MLDLILPYISYDQCSRNKRNVRAIEQYADIGRSRRIDVFDLGCGRGSFLLLFPRRPLNAFGLDISPGATKNLGRDACTVTYTSC